MAELRFRGRTYDRREGETVLAALTRQGVSVPFSCRKGVCLVCLMRSVDGEAPEGATEGLQPRLVAKGYFLACRAKPEGDASVDLPREGDVFGRATVVAKERLSADVCRLRLEPATSLFYHAGQFVNLRRPSDGLVRSYSIASVPAVDPYLEVHVRRVPLGRMSQWVFEELEVGTELDLQGPEGRCFYRVGDLDRPLLLVGTGTGLAPLLGVVRDALTSGHRGPIRLYHGAREPEGLYLHDALRGLAEAHPSLSYVGCVSRPDAELPEGAVAGRASDLAFASDADRSNAHVFLCGLPAMVEAARLRAIEAGAPSHEVRADPFETSEHDPETTEEPDRYPPADPEMWAALGEGPLLRAILDDFYTQVYADPRLNPFFAHTTIQRSIGKQYSFLMRIFTGEPLYFGDRPRNAHHWMVISDELFDYRADLMERTLRRHGLPEHLVRRFVALEESYRRFVVKGRPWPRIMDGYVFPLEGYESLTMDVGALCDSCGREVNVGETMHLHVRLGTGFCDQCYGRRAPPSEAPAGAAE